MTTFPVRISTDPSETEGLRSARVFDREQAEEWFGMVRYGRQIGYEDTATLDAMSAFATAILNNASDVYLSRETEANISRFMNDPRVQPRQPVL